MKKCISRAKLMLKYPKQYTFLLRYDRELLDRLFPSKYTPEQTKKNIILFTEKMRKRPSQGSKNKEEKRLGKSLGGYVSVYSSSYDEEFKKQVDKLCPIIDTASEAKKDIILFIEKTGNRPSIGSKNKEEKRLGERLNSYVAVSSGCYCEEFKKQIEVLSICYIKRVELDFLAKLPPEVKLIGKWQGTNKNNKFIHEKYGKFVRRPADISKAIKKGLSGHPKDGHDFRGKQTSKKVKRISDGKIFNSLTELAEMISCGRRNLGKRYIKNKKPYKGEYYEYVEDEEQNI